MPSAGASTPWLVLLAIAATLAAIVLRPRGVGEAWAAAGGAAAMLALGAVGPAEAWDAAQGTADVLLFLLGMMALTWLVEQAGVFDRLAEGVAGLARGSGVLLLVLVFLLAAAVTAFLSLDVTVLLLTPVVFSLAARRRLDAVPFVFACTFVANTGSLVLPISNLTNLLVYDRLHLGFAPFAGRMWLPNLVAVGVNLAVFLWLFRARIPRRFGDADGETPEADWWFWVAAFVLTATLAGLVGLGLTHRPLAWAPLAGSGLLAAVGLGGRRVGPRPLLGGISWPLFVFVLGMALVVRGFERAWLDRLDVRLPSDIGPAMLVAVGGTALGSNVVNNVPMTLLSLPLVARADPAVRDALAYGALVGANIGPTLTTYGSLATMLWLALVRKRGLDVSTAEYVKVALLTTPLVLVAATLALWWTLR